MIPLSHQRERLQIDIRPNQIIHYPEWSSFVVIGGMIESVSRCDWGRGFMLLRLAVRKGHITEELINPCDTIRDADR